MHIITVKLKNTRIVELSKQVRGKGGYPIVYDIAMA